MLNNSSSTSSCNNNNNNNNTNNSGKEGMVLFNDAVNMFYIWTYSKEQLRQ